MGNPYLKETGCNFADDPDNTTDPDLQATDWDANQANSWTRSGQAVETPFFIRLQVENTGDDSGSKNWQLYYNQTTDDPGGAGTLQVTTTSAVRIVDDGGSNDIPNGATCDARRCASNSNTWQDGEYTDSADDSDKLELVSNYYTEFQFCIYGLPGMAGGTCYFWLRFNDAQLDEYDASNTATVTFSGGALSIDESDSVDVGDAVTVQIPQVFVSEGDGVDVGDAVFVQIPQVFISESDAVGVTDAVILQMPHVVNVSDGIDVADPVSIQIPALFVDSNDGVYVADAVSVQIPQLFVSISDGVGVTSSASVEIPAVGALEVNVADGIEVDGSVALQIPQLFVDTSDAINLEDSVTLQIPQVFVNVADGIELEDSVAIHIPVIFIEVSDGIELADAVTIQSPQLFISVADGADVESSGTVEIPVPGLLQINVSDEIGIVSSTSVQIPSLFVNVSNGVDVVSSATVEIPVVGLLEIDVSDAVALADAPQVLIPQLFVSVSDSVGVTTIATTVIPESFVSIGDGLGVLDNVLVYLTPLGINVVDGVGVVSACNIPGPAAAALEINVAEGISVASATITGIIVTPEIDTSTLCADTEAILEDWAETLSVQRATTTYDAAGQPTQTWAEVDSFSGDWQPVNDATIYVEAGLEVKTDAQILGPCNLDVQGGDRIAQTDGSYMEVNYVAVHEGHTTIYLKETEHGTMSVHMIPTEAANKETLIDDTDTILEDWYESVRVKRRVNTYDQGGVATSTWQTVAIVQGDWHPFSGELQREEEGRAVKSVAQFNARPDISVDEDDQIIRQDGTVYYVNYIRWFEDHCTVRLKRREGQTE